MNESFDVLAAWLADVLLLGSALLVLSLTASCLIHQPAWRMSLAWGTLLGLLLLAVLAACPFWPRQSLWSATKSASDETPSLPPLVYTAIPLNNSADVKALPADATAIGMADRSSDTPPDLRPVSTTTSESVTSLLTTNLIRLWLIGAAFALGWIVLGAWQAARLVRRSQESPPWSRQELAQLVEKQRRQPQLRTSDRIATAVALGARRPHILLPAQSVHEENAAGVRAALAHEWAHIRNGDLWLLALERLLLPLFFWHPLFWLLRRRIRFDQELLADAAAAGEQPLEYAEALLAWARSAVASPARPPLGMAALSLWESPRSLSRRVEMILHAKHPLLPAVSRRWQLLVSTSLLAIVLGLSLVTLRPTAIAQEGVTDYPAKVIDQNASAKKRKQRKARDEARAENHAADRAPAPRPAAESAIQLDMQIYELPQAELALAEIDLGDFIHETSRQCRAEDHLIIADYTSEGLAGMLSRLRKEPGVEILSEPRVLTYSGQEAQVQVGSQVPLVRIAETVNGKANSHIEFLNAGLELTIMPRLDSNKTVSLEIVLERARLEPRANDPVATEAVPTVRKRTIKVETDVVIGEAAVIVERDQKVSGGKPGPILLLTITPSPMKGPSPNPKGDEASKARSAAIDQAIKAGDGIESLHKENDQLRQEIAQLQRKLIDLEDKLASLREAAAPGGKEKVSDEDFLRRVYLDLMGVPPRAEEMRVFLKDEDANKRTKLIDRLLAAAKDRAQDDSSQAPPGNKVGATEAVGPADPAQRVVKIFALKDTPAQSVIDAIERLRKQGKSKIELQAMARDERTNSLLVQGTAEELVFIGAIIAELDAAGAKTPPREKEPDELDQRLHALDIREAEITLKAAQSRHERLQELSKTGAGVVSQQEVLSAAAELEKAQVAVEQVKVRGDRVKSQQLEVRLGEGMLRAAQVNLERVSSLVQSGQVSTTELDSARFEVEKAEVALERAKTRLEAVQRKEKGNRE